MCFFGQNQCGLHLHIFGEQTVSAISIEPIQCPFSRKCCWSQLGIIQSHLPFTPGHRWDIAGMIRNHQKWAMPLAKLLRSRVLYHRTNPCWLSAHHFIGCLKVSNFMNSQSIGWWKVYWGSVRCRVKVWLQCCPCPVSCPKTCDTCIATHRRRLVQLHQTAPIKSHHSSRIINSSVKSQLNKHD